VAILPNDPNENTEVITKRTGQRALGDHAELSLREE
jgi:hypothetical protein